MRYLTLKIRLTDSHCPQVHLEPSMDVSGTPTLARLLLIEA